MRFIRGRAVVLVSALLILVVSRPVPGDGAGNASPPAPSGHAAPLPGDLRAGDAVPVPVPATERLYEPEAQAVRLTAPAAAVAEDVDLLVVYTAEARARAGGEAVIRTEILSAVDGMNAAFAASGAGVRVRLVWADVIPFVETGASAFDLERIQDPSDGIGDSVHQLRDRFGADVVSLVVSTSDAAGRAYQLAGTFPGFESYAFSVVHVDYMDSHYGLAHEVGHNLGAGHDMANGGGDGPSAHGQRLEGFFRTIMAYPCIFEGMDPCPTVGHYSNPDVFYGGYPTGSATADNARVIDGNAAYVAAFRPAVVAAGAHAPEVDAGGDAFVVLGDPFTRTGTFWDPGSVGWTATVDYGDGSGPKPLSVDAEGFAVSRTYATAGEYAIEVCVVDNSGLVGCETITVRVGENRTSYGGVDSASGAWHLRANGGSVSSFYFGNPGDVPFMGDWDCDGIDTPGLYRQSDGFVYLRNSNSQGVADLEFFFGNPGDVPLAGDFDGDGCDTVSIWRPSEARVFVINELGEDGGGLGAAGLAFWFGSPGDQPFVGDLDGDGVDEVGLHRASTGLVYYRDTLTTGVADHQFVFGDPGDRMVAGDWTSDGVATVGLFRPSTTTFHLRYLNAAGAADESLAWGTAAWHPVAGEFGLD